MKLKSPEKEEEIYRVVLEITAERGLTGLKMSEIARQAGLAHGTVYIYFKNKKDLINKLYQKAKRSSSSHIMQTSPKEGSFMEKLRLLWKNYLSYLVHNQKEIYFMQQCLSSTFLEEESRQLSDRFLQQVTTFFEQGQQERYIKNMSITLLLSVLIGLGKEITTQINQQQLSFDEQLIEDSFDLCWNAIRR